MGACGEGYKRVWWRYWEGWGRKGVVGIVKGCIEGCARMSWRLKKSVVKFMEGRVGWILWKCVLEAVEGCGEVYGRKGGVNIVKVCIEGWGRVLWNLGKGAHFTMHMVGCGDVWSLQHTIYRMDVQSNHIFLVTLIVCRKNPETFSIF